MIPFGTVMVTLIHRREIVEDGKTHVRYERYMLRGCSWRRKSAWQQFDTEKTRTDEITCRIPADQRRPEAGDYLFMGEINDTITGTRELQAAMRAHRNTGAMQITSVSDNTGSGVPMPHYAAWGA